MRIATDRSGIDHIEESPKHIEQPIRNRSPFTLHPPAKASSKAQFCLIQSTPYLKNHFTSFLTDPNRVPNHASQYISHQAVHSGINLLPIRIKGYSDAGELVQNLIPLTFQLPPDLYRNTFALRLCEALWQHCATCVLSA